MSPTIPHCDRHFRTSNHGRLRTVQPTSFSSLPGFQNPSSFRFFHSVDSFTKGKLFESCLSQYAGLGTQFLLPQFDVLPFASGLGGGL